MITGLYSGCVYTNKDFDPKIPLLIPCPVGDLENYSGFDKLVDLCKQYGITKNSILASKFGELRLGKNPITEQPIALYGAYKLDNESWGYISKMLTEGIQLLYQSLKLPEQQSIMCPWLSQNSYFPDRNVATLEPLILCPQPITVTFNNVNTTKLLSILQRLSNQKDSHNAQVIHPHKSLFLGSNAL